MSILILSSRCPDCDERMMFKGFGGDQVCGWCANFGVPTLEDDE